jgi:hypothetical protein
MSRQFRLISNPLDWVSAAEARARDFYAECCRRSADREEKGAPTLEEMQAQYRSVYEYGKEFAPTEFFPDEDALVDAINEEYFARHGMEFCVEQELERMRYNRSLQTRLALVVSDSVN